jgi:hypothetical protein
MNNMYQLDKIAKSELQAINDYVQRDVVNVGVVIQMLEDLANYINEKMPLGEEGCNDK